METPFSPGPWRIDENNGQRIKVVDDRGALIHIVEFSDIPPEVSDLMRNSIIQRERENAFLMCAAPKLFEACSAALNWYGPNGEGITDPIRQKLWDALSSVRYG
jgi:hypothetical protein